MSVVGSRGKEADKLSSVADGYNQAMTVCRRGRCRPLRPRSPPPSPAVIPAKAGTQCA